MLNVEVTGSGIPLVFLHGYGEDLSLWNRVSHSLKKNYKVILIDLPGFGKSDPLNPAFNLDDIAHHIMGYLTKTLSLDKYIVFGHSLGGYVALALRDLYPNAIIGFGLINSNAYADTKEKKANRDKTALFISKHGGEFFLKSFVPNLFLPTNQKVLATDVENVLAMGSMIADTVLVSYLAAMRDREDRSHLLGKSDNILFIGGLYDQLISNKVMENQIRLIKSKVNVHIFKDVAHMSMIESPKRFETAIIDFIKTIKCH